MEKFTNIGNKTNKNDIVFSELTALCYFNPSFFDFLNDDKWRYLTNDNVFANSLYFELQNYPIKLIDNEPLHINIENDWDSLQSCQKVANELREKIPNCESILIQSNILNFQSGDSVEVFRGKLKSEMVTQNDLEKATNIPIDGLYGEKTDTIIKMFLEHIKEYLKPKYLEGLRYFLDIFWEKGHELTYDTYKNFKATGLGIRMDELPKLYYNNLCDYSKDLILFEGAFREYGLMVEQWLSLKNDSVNKNYLLPTFKGMVDINSFVMLVEKYYSLANIGYYTVDMNDDVLRLPSKKEFEESLNNDIKVSYRTNNTKDLLICVDWEEIEARIKVSFGLVPDEFSYSLDIVEKKVIE